MIQANSRLPAEDLSQGGVPDGNRGCGARLRKAREAAGLTVDDVAARLKMPVRVVRSLEEEDWSRLGAPVFVRGQLRSYSKLLGLMTAPMVAASGVAPVEPPALVPRSYTPPMQRMMEQVGRRLVYIVLTAAIAVPVWLATRPHLGVVLHDAAPLDVPASVGKAVDRTPDATDPKPLVASLTPMAAESAPAPVLAMQLTGDSWVQITGQDGAVLEQSVLHAGDERSYRAGQVARIVIGNIESVRFSHDGKAVDLEQSARSNVARFAVSSDGSLVPVAD
jgi:cytoskeleton protein RodZ